MKKKLVSLRDKLNNISKSNRSIRLLKKYNKWTFDLSELLKMLKNPLEILEKLRSTNVRQPSQLSQVMMYRCNNPKN